VPPAPVRIDRLPGRASFRAGMRDWYRGQDPGFTDRTMLLAETFRVLWR
jgi:hypothetical protein